MTPLHILIVVWVMLGWAFNAIIVKLAMQHWSVFAFTAARFGLLIPLLIFCWVKPAGYRRLVMLACVFAGGFCMSSIALDLGIQAGLLALLFQTNIFFAVIWSYFLNKDKPTLYEILGMLLAFLGVLFLLSDTFSFEGVHLLSVAVALLGASMMGLYSTLMRRTQMTNAFSGVIWVNSLAFFPIAGLAIHQLGLDACIACLQQINPSISLYLFISSFVLTALSGYLWYLMIRRYPLSTLGSYMFLTPLFAFILANIVLDEQFNYHEFGACIMILLGIIVSQLGHKIRHHIVGPKKHGS